MYGVNTIEVGRIAMLLTSTGGGVAIHLTRAEDGSATARLAVPAFYSTSDHRCRHIPH
jgi:hypothetical protein